MKTVKKVLAVIFWIMLAIPVVGVFIGLILVADQDFPYHQREEVTAVVTRPEVIEGPDQGPLGALVGTAVTGDVWGALAGGIAGSLVKGQQCEVHFVLTDGTTGSTRVRFCGDFPSGKVLLLVRWTSKKGHSFYELASSTSANASRWSFF